MLRLLLVVGLSLAGCTAAEPGSPAPRPPPLDELEPSGFLGTPALTATVGITWRYEPIVVLPGTGEPALELVASPEAMTIDGDGVVTYTPVEGDEGEHEVVLVATLGDARAEQSLVIHVSGRTRIARATVPPSGGSVLVEGTGTSVDGLEIVVPGYDGATDATVDVYVVAGDGPAVPAELTAIGPAFFVESDLPEEIEVTARMSLAGLMRAAGGVAASEIVMTSHGPRGLHSGEDEERTEESAPVEVGEEDDGFIDWIIRRVRRGRLERIYRASHGPNVAEVRDQFRIVYLLDAGQRRDGVRARLGDLADVLMAARDHLTGIGCVFRDTQIVIVRDIEGYGEVHRDDGLLEIDKPHFDGDPRAAWMNTVAHELTHVMQWVALGRVFPNADETWWIESTAEYGASEVFGPHYVTSLGEWNARLSRRGVENTLWRFFAYPLVVLWKSIDAQRGGFNVCTMASERAARGSGHAALDAILGSDTETLRAYATFVAAWNFIRTDAVLEDASLLFPGGAGGAEFVTAPSPRMEDDAQVYEWTETVDTTPGGYSARLGGLDEPQQVTVEVVSPTRGFVGYVHSASHELLGELGEGAATLELASVEGDFYVTVAMRMDQEIEWEPSHDNAVHVVATARPIAAACSPDGSPCSGSGEAFDDECCEGFICVVGACREPVGGREGTSCEDPSTCASGLACSPQGSATGASTCCARDGDYCVTKTDCCGYQECTDNRCIGQETGEACVLGDCVGASFCSDGTCT